MRAVPLGLLAWLVSASLMVPDKRAAEPIIVQLDPGIRAEAEKHFTAADFPMGSLPEGSLYKNELLMEVYTDGKLTVNTAGQKKSRMFKSFYYWYKDTLYIDGAFGLFTGAGFSAKVYDGKAEVRHLLSSDENPGYGYTATDSLKFRLDVPCSDTRLILSHLPDTTAQPIIHGYVEFKSATYYSAGGAISEDGEYLDPRTKSRTNMKIWFRSNHLKL